MTILSLTLRPSAGSTPWLAPTTPATYCGLAIIRMSKRGWIAASRAQQSNVGCSFRRGQHECHRRILLQRGSAYPGSSYRRARRTRQEPFGLLLDWLSEPSVNELRALQATYNLHPLAIDNAMHPICPPKLEVYNGEFYVVAQTAELVGDRIRYGKTAIFTGHNHLITVRHGNAGALGNLREQLERSPAQFGKGVDYVLHAILHRIVDQYLPIFEMIEDDVLAMERRSLDDFLGRDDVARIFGLRCELTRFQRTLGAMAELVRKLVRGHFPRISAEVRPYFNDVADHVDRVQSMVDGLLQVLSTVFEFSSLLEAQRIGSSPPTCGMGRDPRSADSDEAYTA